LQVVDSGGPTEVQQQRDQLVMQPIAELGQREEAVYRLVAQGKRAGDHVLRVQLVSDETESARLNGACEGLGLRPDWLHALEVPLRLWPSAHRLPPAHWQGSPLSEMRC
jgi:hypothetical protein